MIRKRTMTRTLLIGPALGAILGAGILLGCTGDTEGREGAESNHIEASQSISERGEGSSGEHGSGGEEGSGAVLAPDQTFDMVRGGARLILGYDPASNAFTGTVENTTSNVLTRVRIEVHLSNGTELGPTTPVDMAPGQVMQVHLPATAAPFTGWTPHAEVGSGEGSESGGGEHGAGGEGSGARGSESGGEGSGTGSEAGEAAMSSPIIPLDQSWNGTLGGLAISAQYDAVTRSVQATVQNTLGKTLCYVQAEPHLKSGTRTVGELGPDVLGHLSPGQQATSSVSVASEPALAGVSFDGYVVHMEVFDCSGPGPVPHTGGEGAGGEEGSGANALALSETFDTVRGGARLILNYDAASNAFVGSVENTTGNVLQRVRIEVHLSNGTELGPTTPVDMASGQVMQVHLPATAAPFTGWTPHAEVGSGEGGEAGGERSESGGGEHGSSRESGGEHGSGGEGSGGS